MKPDFTKIPFEKPLSFVVRPVYSPVVRLSSEGIKIKSQYTPQDFQALTHTDYIAELPPFLRGPYGSM